MLLVHRFQRILAPRSRLPKLIRVLGFLTAALLVSVATSMSRQRTTQHLVYVGAYWVASWLLIIVLQVRWA